MTAEPVRVGPVVAAIVNVTEPGPAPAAGETVIHESLLAVVHGHPADEAIVTVPDPPAEPAA